MDTIAHIGDPEKSPKATRELADVPGPKGVPLFGNMLQIESTQFHLALENWAHEFGPYYKIRLGSKQILIISDQVVIGQLLRDRPEALSRSSRTSLALTELGTSGVFTDEGDEWRKQRKLVMRALTPEVVRNFFPTLRAMTERLLERWQRAATKGQPIDLLRDLKAFTLDVTVALAMGQDINTLEHDANPLQRDIEFIFHRVARRITSPFPYWRYFKLPVDRAADASALRIYKAITGFIEQTRARLDADPGLRAKPSNMLEALVAARDEPDSGFTDDHVIGNAGTMVFAGEDTTSNTIAWLLNFVAREPEVAARIAAEADALLGENRVPQEFGVFDQLNYLEAATTEAMRLKPVAPFLGMEANLDMQIADIRVPKGTLIMVSLRNAAQQQIDFPHADQFDPERWLSDSKMTNSDGPGRKLFPFGGGPRFCPGRFLAMAEIKMVVATIARNFVMEVPPDAAPVTELFTFTVTPSSLPVRLVPRHAASDA